MRDTILCLCDLSGVFAEPWVEAGYRAVLIDPQHGFDHDDGRVTLLARTVDEAMPFILDLINENRIRVVASFPPCTDLAVSGARWFSRKYSDDHLFQAKAISVAEQCRTVGRLSGAPWFVENPVSVLSRVFGHPDSLFQPWWFTRWEPRDNYRKLTCLWHGGGWRQPPKNVDATLGPPDDRIHNCQPGPDRANIRSRTPRGFSIAAFHSNEPIRWEGRKS